MSISDQKMLLLKGLQSDDKVSQDESVSENLLNEVSKLKAEIADLKQSVKIKEDQLNKKNDDEIHFLRLIKKL